MGNDVRRLQHIYDAAPSDSASAIRRDDVRAKLLLAIPGNARRVIWRLPRPAWQAL